MKIPEFKISKHFSFDEIVNFNQDVIRNKKFIK